MLNAVCQRYQPDAHYTLRGRVLKILRDGVFEQRIVSGLGDYKTILLDVFALQVPEADLLWEKVTARHATLFPES